ncbi:MAG: ribosome assembly RNA-binding protein YhbY [Alkalibacterium gilvum]|uniref:RNA-binding protein n=1 Tax=Alkalibacterium gilvum TaxID=1130080 RepID=A0A1H6TPY7_9LACT|nr:MULTISPECIES: ribosome assembly RNA-binding protein YhbY [Alkalibacterium]MDN6194280.1 ribosome assembly RNA-binding protein YhbY [Alkalibacterium sp.]MDN6293139.1 ribosome assembly RNA-binding protein YhbY [Alkalibacterium sp.]MDN6295048.1 ribosome assembly RNA-binding protein YhbY [Alkalibacterium sp.]MDN6397584.1 ribosome assembly RNA-binding protein YhbY [Alkalibacterium sp.]MDN6729966.1 ribosome assembly RNA-binding protein YhbY [Alkalibacterium sp.]
MNFTGKQKRFLRSEANGLSPIFQIGKNGLTVDMITEFQDSIENKELMKVQLLQNTDWTASEAVAFIEENSDITVVQKVGKVLVLYKASDKEKYQRYSSRMPKSNHS